MNLFEYFFKDLSEAHMHTQEYKDDCMVEIMCRRQEFERNLDEMWAIYKRGNMNQVFEYRKQIEAIKSAGLVVLRHKTTGKHKITYQK